MRENGIDRRAFLRGGAAAGVAAVSLTACSPRSDRGTTRTKSSGPLVVRDIGGTYGAANRRAVYDPFSRETGIQIKVVNILHEQMIAQIKEGRPRFDVMDINMTHLALFKHEGVSEELDYDRLKNARNAGIAESLLTSHGVGKNYWASVLAYRTDAFGGKRPESWADFWSTGQFPGRRALQGALDWPELEFALLADGVPLDKLYPLDVDRAFTALDDIKGSELTFWESGGVPGELLGRRKVVASSVWNGRVQSPVKDGSPLAYAWNGARRQSNGYGIPKGAANPEAAYRLIDFALRPEVQAHFARIHPEGPVVPAAYAHLTETAAAPLASSPGHLQSGFDLDVEWWVENGDAVTRRWQAWART
ncbi:putative Spermidine/putrescine-binding periplasmic protein 2 [Streptomyces afghaniensis 772]|uniref:Putative Spermidine/putrescine-binding periplasmic protein 2 n=1 Tax=Streptomyces afghaniensis 772 TaxID=1283301 RepID=S4NU67_9ACTN|nr:ABC transporter substrate-binding protein [Streptomyces afghaniensis]EPJ41959.1 putative Spermidine/putrescine-binding periplasmic protein 2 [Streptomyces afghaniensis 772]